MTHGASIDDDEFRFNSLSADEGHLCQNGKITWYTSVACLNCTSKTLTKTTIIFSKFLTLTSRSLMWVEMVQHKISDQYLTSGQV